ncbi:MAG: hypothetical protein M3041_01630 [Acidobacteriota bacterium]|nr:hypothetical protein [Acidobacteriota bacterium]
MASTCKLPEIPAPPKDASRIHGGEGKLVHLDLQPTPDAPVLISSKDVQVQRDFFDHLIVDFDRLEFVRGKVQEPQYTLDSIAVRLAVTGEREKREGETDLKDLKLTAQNPRATANHVQVKIDDGAKSCATLCRLVVYVKIGIPLSKGDLGGIVQVSTQSMADIEALPVDIRLMTGTATAADQNQCKWLSPEEATAITGKPMKFSYPDTADCTMEAEDGKAQPIFYVVVDDAGPFAEKKEDRDAQPATIGDQSVWIPRITALWVVKGSHLIGVRIGPYGRPPGATPAVRATAEAIARKILEKL